MRLALLAAIIGLGAFAHAELTVFDVRRSLPMSDGEKIFRDYYINGGSEAGLSVGMVVTVQRRVPLYDNYSNHSAGDLDLKVAKIKIIHVQKGLAVARLHGEFTRDNAPLLEDNFIMIGDRLNMATATSDGDKKADAEKPNEAPVADATPAEAIKTAAKIVVNTVELSSQAPAAPQAQLPQNVQAPSLQ